MINIPIVPIAINFLIFFVINFFVWIVITRKVKTHYLYNALLYTVSVVCSILIVRIILYPLHWFSYDKTIHLVSEPWQIFTGVAAFFLAFFSIFIWICAFYFQFFYAPASILKKFGVGIAMYREISKTILITFFVVIAFKVVTLLLFGLRFKHLLQL